MPTGKDLLSEGTVWDQAAGGSVFLRRGLTASEMTGHEERGLLKATSWEGTHHGQWDLSTRSWQMGLSILPRDVSLLLTVFGFPDYLKLARVDGLPDCISLTFLFNQRVWLLNISVPKETLIFSRLLTKQILGTKGVGVIQLILKASENSRFSPSPFLSMKSLWVSKDLPDKHFGFLVVACFLFIDFRERKWKKEREKQREKHQFCCSSYLCIHWLILGCALTRDWTQ